MYSRFINGNLEEIVYIIDEQIFNGHIHDFFAAAWLSANFSSLKTGLALL